MRSRLLLGIMLLLWVSCATRKPTRTVDDIADFSLSSAPIGVKVDDREYFNDLQRSESTIGFESSFPLPFSVGRAVDPYDNVPDTAKTPVESKISFQLGSCRFTLLTGPIQVDRYLLAGQWIKLTEGLPARVPVKLEPQMDLNLKIVTQILVEVPDTQRNVCRKMLEGKRIVIGNFHLNKSRIGLLAAPKSPSILFSSRSMEPKGKRVSLRWAVGANEPVLLDDFDFPATCESGIFRTVMGSKGFYHLVFQPVLRMDGYDQMVIRLPFPPGSNGGPPPAGTQGAGLKAVPGKKLEPSKAPARPLRK